jgi:hypothetical protein
MTISLDRLYEEDFYRWTQHQARALRRLASIRMNEPLDIPHLAEEVRDLGKSERDAVRSQITRILEHALKLAFSPAQAPRAGWIETIDDARRELHFKLSPSLRRDAAARLPDLYAYARRRVARTLARHGEPEAEAALPEACPWKLAEILDEAWLPGDQGA